MTPAGVLDTSAAAASVGGRDHLRRPPASRVGEHHISVLAESPRAAGRGDLCFPGPLRPADHPPTDYPPTRLSADQGQDDAHAQGHAVHEVPALSLGRACRPHLAGPADHQGAPVVLGRPARRQPGPRRPHGHRSQAAHVRPSRRHGLQGDRGGLPGRLPARLRLLPQAHRRGPDPRRGHHPGAHPGPRRTHRAHLRRRRRSAPGHRAPLQLHLHHPATGGVPHRPGRHRRDRGERRRAVHARPRPGPEGRRRRRHPLRVLPGELHRHRARLHGGGVRGGHGRDRTRRPTGP